MATSSDSSLQPEAHPPRQASVGPRKASPTPKKGPPPLPRKSPLTKSDPERDSQPANDDSAEAAELPALPASGAKRTGKRRGGQGSRIAAGGAARPAKPRRPERPEPEPLTEEPSPRETRRASRGVSAKAARRGHATSADLDDEEAYDDEAPEARRGFRAWVANSAAMLVSMIGHLALLLMLGLWMLPGIQKEYATTLVVNPSEDSSVEEELTTELESPLEEESMDVSSAVNAVAEGVAAAHSAISNAPSLQQSPSEMIQGMNIAFDGPPIKTPGPASLVSALPRGQVGEARAIVDNYDQALDRITQEILMMLAESKVLVVWCFDESESMKDDQQEIRDRIDHVYTELGLKDAAQGDALLTSICSYGAKFTMRTSQPTSKLIDIKDAIDSIDIDPSGLENMCSAVGQAITVHAGFAKGGRRQMALILVTDESGEHDDNNLYVEPMVQAALAAKCRVYTLGRESVFGYPYAHISWRHPQTGHVHWLPINRGPETGFVEQLRTEASAAATTRASSWL